MNSSPSFTTDVLICGAGAAGLTLAIELARRNVSFRIIEKLPTSFRGSRGKGIQPRSLEIFEDLGVVDRLFAKGGAYPPQRGHNADGTFDDEETFSGGKPNSEEPYQFPVMVPQFLTESLLRDRLAELGYKVDFDSELLEFKQNGREIVSEIKNARDHETIRSRFLIGCDGGKSLIRHALNIEFPGKTLGIRAIVADVEAEGVPGDYWHRWSEGDFRRQVSICPLRGTGLFQIQGPIPLEGDTDLSVKGFNELLDSRIPNNKIVVRRVQWASAYLMNARMADKYQVGRVFLCGDAAHIHPPTGGQGLNTGVQDAYNLGWKLAAVLEGAPAKLLTTYEEERRPIAAEVLGLSTQLLEAVKTRGKMDRGRHTQQLDLGYNSSSLCLTKPERVSSKLIAGDRAPDATLQTAMGFATRLFRFLEGPRWTLFGYETVQTPTPRSGMRIHTIGKGGEIVDHLGQFRESYNVTAGDWVLIRPDGYIGAIVSSEHLPELLQYLDTVGVIQN